MLFFQAVFTQLFKGEQKTNFECPNLQNISNQNHYTQLSADAGGISEKSVDWG